ncbi:diguanylate cyclase/phosphodiesterase (GGDEF & EAL domains) with PAS/PAC sensor(s) [Sulfuriferula multivorans]|uniref:Diguanylate cyclase/phosphodiesterase (GGDEF & EAL domains) with PAS/PAC sensor(S) n=1 Tax=Sulfuriferula multivorans TaxID=1559896 RepID=A0A401JZ02_9PROT|nr:EAL domain-containing protein [Sulfuriferula multivorans]GCB02283.1 diguanylate cyclase/phosphodiesterase (GGDEF & EAL domains) with PAS/PAC sensor(s) [Sulfuriferula multivorans]
MKSRKNNGIEILIAEDSPTQAEKLQYLLEERGYTVVTAPDGKQALVAARRHKPALIVSDVMMPEMDGFALCGEIKRDEQLQDVPVILLTTLSDVRDIMKGLECGADNFIRKPYEERYLLARVDYLLMNNELRKNQKMQMGVEIYLGGQKHFITAERQQIVDLLISVYEEAVHISEELKARQRELADSNSSLSCLYHVAEGLNRAMSEREVCDQVLERVMELPGVQAGWISLWENDTFRTAAVRNLPPALLGEGAMEGLCECRRRFLAGELDHVTNILECERLKYAKGDTYGLRYHACVPLWSGDRSLGVMNLVGADQGLFKDDELETLYGVGHQVGIALERTRLHGHLEQLVEERTAALTTEIAERKRIQEEQARLVAIIEATPDMVGTASPDGRLLYINQAGLRMLGYEKGDDVSTQQIKDRHPGWAGKLVLEEGIPHALRHGTWSGETAFLRRDGSEVPVLQVIIAHKKPDGSLEYLSTVGHDITQRKEQESKINRLNRIYSVLSGINTTIVRVRERQQLFDEACRIAVEHGKFTFAWIGTLDADTLQVTPVARAGRDDGYLARINLTATEDAPGNCHLTARALTQQQPVICNDIATDEAMQSLRAEALQRGYRSVAVFPLLLEDRPVGVFVLYAPETNVFDAEEMRLLVEMAGDISFALDHLEKEQRLNYLAYYDAVTGLPNRTLFLDRVTQKINAAHRDRKVFSVIMLDLNRFSSINETLGRQAGDELLRQITQRLQRTLVETDILARFSADYFGIATRYDDENVNIVHILDGVLSVIQNRSFVISGQELRVSARAGISTYPADGEDIEALFHNAESALKKTKLSGDKYLFYTPAFNALAAEKLSLENKLRRALEQEQLVLHYQPKIDLNSGQISGLEALLRWNDPETGLVPPLQFIPLLEETGMILEAGQWALEKAVSDSLAWLAKGLPSPRVAVNVSPIQLQQKNFVSMIEGVVKGNGDVASRLELEITESLVMQDIVANIQKLRMIREMGVEVAIDDFGTGYSSLSYIAKLPVSALKIDRAFIMNMTSNSDDQSIVSTIISLAHSLNMRVVAEGVETEDQAKLLRLLKCDEIQGFLFSPGVPAEQIERFLRERKSLLG